MDRSIEINSMDFHQVNCMIKCNAQKKKILVTRNKFSQETAVLRKIVVQAETCLILGKM